MIFRAALPEEFPEIQSFYWNLIDTMQAQETIGWKKGVYPTDELLKSSLARGEAYVLLDGKALCACVVLNHSGNEGYRDVSWSETLEDREVLIPHALAVCPARQGSGVGKRFMQEIFELARQRGYKAMRLDILAANRAAERLYTGAGFSFVQEKTMFYADTGWAAYRMFERRL